MIGVLRNRIGNNAQILGRESSDSNVGYSVKRCRTDVGHTFSFAPKLIVSSLTMARHRKFDMRMGHERVWPNPVL